MSDDKAIESVIYPVRELCARLDVLPYDGDAYRETRRSLLRAIVEAGIDIETAWRAGASAPPLPGCTR